MREFVHLSLQRIRWLGEGDDVVRPPLRKHAEDASPQQLEGKGKDHTNQPAFKRSASHTVAASVAPNPKQTTSSGPQPLSQARQ